MGIPSYFSYIIRNFPKIVRSVHSDEIEYCHLFMDCNSIIYDTVHGFVDNIPTDDNIIDAVLCQIDKYIREISPKYTIYIAFDGVAPFAKMKQQRTRRYKSHLMSEIFPSYKQKWDTVKITPGTEFMKKLSKSVMTYFDSSENRYNVSKVIVSTSNEPGEGEHKLFQYIRDNDFKNDNVIIYGLDSDLFMLSIFNHEYYKNSYIFREAPAFLKSNISLQINNNSYHSGDKKTVQEHGSFLVDIEMLRGQILKEMGFSDTNRVYDYAFLCFLLGNDFLPHFPALNIRTHGTQVLMDVYHKEFNNKPQQFLVIKDKDTNLFNIEWKNVNKIIKRLSQLEHELLLKEYNVREKYDHWKWNDPKNDDDKEKMVQDIPIRYRMDEKYICPTENGWESRYYKLLFEEDTESLRRKICEEYNGGLEWVLNYYTNNDVDWHWHYEYDYGPLFKDLMYSVERSNNKVLINEDHKLPMSEYAQLSYVIPDKNNTEIKNVRWAFTRYFWEAHV